MPVYLKMGPSVRHVTDEMGLVLVILRPVCVVFSLPTPKGPLRLILQLPPPSYLALKA